MPMPVIHSGTAAHWLNVVNPGSYRNVTPGLLRMLAARRIPAPANRPVETERTRT